MDSAFAATPCSTLHYAMQVVLLNLAYCKLLWSLVMPAPMSSYVNSILHIGIWPEWHCWAQAFQLYAFCWHICFCRHQLQVSAEPYNRA